ncbi:MAG TPA: DNA-formamidopyrimidine glycosylase family protein [Vicinamibacteria bacterium]|nr:DNA-formamidopyrimidine glycosylase family protein [Vicinamibacteria bacterium]
MPELPDLLHIQSRLGEALAGARVVGERVREPVVLRFAVRGNLSLLLGRRLDAVLRHAHFLVFRFEDLDLAVNPMLAGRFRLAEPGEKEERDLVFSLAFDSGRELRYRDEKKMGKAYLLAKGDWKAAPGMEAGGLDVLSPEFTRERFVSLLKRRRDQVRLFLMDKRALDSIGNAYADEILFEASLHPKTFCRSLSHDDAVRLHDAVVKVMREAVDEVARRAEPIDVKVRDFLKVRRREVCPRCGSKVRKAGVRGMDAYFCPRCQPATRSGLVDWTKTGR